MLRGVQLKRVRGDVEGLVTTQDLRKVKTRALRRKIWFGALSRVERSIVDLTIRCVERIRSRVLGRMLLAILTKLRRRLDESFLHRADTIGCEIADRICHIALKWGNLQARTWKSDQNFVRFLGVRALNTYSMTNTLVTSS